MKIIKYLKGRWQYCKEVMWLFEGSDDLLGLHVYEGKQWTKVCMWEGRHDCAHWIMTTKTKHMCAPQQIQNHVLEYYVEIQLTLLSYVTLSQEPYVTSIFLYWLFNSPKSGKGGSC